MNVLDTKIYKDGNRTIVVFNNTNPKTEDIIKNIIGAATGNVLQSEKIANIVPMKTTPEPMPVIPQNLSENQPAIEDINEQKIFEEKGFAGYVEVYKYYLFNKNVLSEERKTELLNFINLHATMMKQTDPANLSEDQLREILNIGFSSIFEKKLPEILRATTCLSKDVLLNSGKQFLDYAYNVCVGRMVA